MAAAVGLAERGYLELGGAERSGRHGLRELVFSLPGGGASPSAVRYPESAGGFWYQENAQLGSVTRNRFIHWATSGATLELVEESLDINLLNNAVQLRFQNCNLLPQGVHIFETQNHVVILVSTNQTVHRLMLPHPARMYRSELITESQMQSVFTDIGKLHFRDPLNYCVIPTVPGLSPFSTASAAWLTGDGGSLFALPSASGGIFVLNLPPYDAREMPSTSFVELKQSSVMQRLLTGWMPTAIRGDQNPSDLPVSLSVHCREHDALLFALYQDHKLRMWSYKNQMCLMVADMLEFVPVNKDLRLIGGSGHRLQLAYSESLGLYIGVYLHAPRQGQFCVFQLVSTESHRYSLDHISSLFTSQETLIDFALTTSEIWALWHDDENQTTVKYINFEHNVAGQWNQVSVQPLPAEEVNIRDDQDPRETFTEAIFLPGQFTNAALLKALQIFSQEAERYKDLSWDELKKEITIALEDEFQGNVTEYEFSHEEFRQLQIEFWSKFYAYCLQYQEELSRPLALLLNHYTNMVCLLKKGYFSFLVPCSLMDHLYLLPDEQLINEVESAGLDESDFSHDLLSLLQCLRLIGESVSVEMALTMEMACFRLQSPERAAEQILKDLIANDTENMMEDIHSKLQEIKNPVNAIGMLIREMDYETDVEMDRGFSSVQPINVRMHLSQLYGSSTTVNMVCRCVYKMSMTRLLICRDLLILQQLLLRLGDAILLGGDQLFHTQQNLLHRTSILLLSYYVIRWASQRLASDVPVDELESNLQHLSVLKLTDSTTITPLKLVSCPQTIVELFFQEGARKHIISQLFQSNAALDETCLSWPQMFSAISSYLLQFLWPSNPNFLFPECLMGACQYAQLQEYIRLLEPWCHVNVGSCRFMMGHCYLVTGEHHKALDCFCQAASEVGKEEFLDRLIRSEEVEMASTPQLQYYDKVLHLLDTMGLPELIIQLATLAITEAADDWRSQATLRTCIFKHHLDLGHNNQAYEALTHNPDPSRQLDCLRQLVVVLCERSQLQDLVEFPYVNLHNEVVGIIEYRARAVDLMTHNYYELLYAFHIYRHNYRKAGTVMFEYGMRLGREVRTLPGLQKQANCYLAAINCLRLIRPQYAWIVQPASGAVYERPGASPKRNHDGECAAAPTGSHIEILELQDLEKECMLAHIRLTLAQHDPTSAAITGNSSPKELVALLVQAGLFDTAISLCQTYKLSLRPVFEGLTFKCIKLQFGGEAVLAEAWDWLAANQLSSVITTKKNSATDEAWRLLASYLDKYKSENSPYHRCVINKLLSHGVPLPNWLINSYKKVDAAELLRLYLNYDLLEEAVDLVLEYVDALLGKGHDYFGIEFPLSATTPIVWLPYSAIDQLLQVLGENTTNHHNTMLYQKVRDKLEVYQKQVDKATRVHLLYCRN
ncbi:nuclear pore complex protein Nup160 isoform X2 [Pseudonaja textilis]|uniref:nuclear pore complex protein Nup160 isoform X2 n=1 Tax=Pseudonaja textilis TaxID=8673 RepID=UPI000EA8E62C|nr:nuclear pore complex protein Nup160 isoform X2 [Pseudonaja textilis]